MRIRRRSLWIILVAVATVILAVLLVLIAVGTLSLPGKSAPADLRIYQAQFTILQGNNASGLPWFGPNFTYEGVANGYPFSLTPGSEFTLPLLLYNVDNVNHTIYSMSASPPFSLISTSPGLPRVVQPVDVADDSGSFDLTLQAPNSPGDNLTLYITIDTLSPAPTQDLSIQSSQFTILQGNNASGLPWFGPNFTYEGVANGYPFSLTPGARFTLPLLLYNYDSSNHTIYSISASPPFSFVASSPGLPRIVEPVDLADDSGSFDLTLQAPNSPDHNVTLYITIDALAP